MSEAFYELLCIKTYPPVVYLDVRNVGVRRLYWLFFSLGSWGFKLHARPQIIRIQVVVMYPSDISSWDGTGTGACPYHRL